MDVDGNMIADDRGEDGANRQSEAAKLFAEDPYARLLMMVGRAAEMKSGDYDGAHRQPMAAQRCIAPIWASEQEREGVAQCAKAAATMADGEGWGGYTRSFLRAGGAPAASTLRHWSALAMKKDDKALAAELEEAAGFFDLHTAPADIEVKVAKAAANSMARGLMLYMEEGSVQEPEAGRVDALMAAGRAMFADGFALGLDGLDALGADPRLCEALCRLCFLGPTNQLLVSAMLTGDADANLLEVLTALHLPNGEGERQKKHRYQRSTKADLAKEANVLAQGLEGLVPKGSKALGLAAFMSGSKLSDYFSGGMLPMGHLRMALFSLKADEPWRSKARAAIMAGASTAEDPNQDKAWKSIGPEGDVSAEALGRPAKRLMGASARGGAMRESLRDFHAIYQWRRPGKLLCEGPREPVGPKGISAALIEAQSFFKGGPMALAAAMGSVAGNSSCRRPVAAALAARVSEGFVGLSEEPDLAELLPAYEPVAASDIPDGFFAGEAKKDPMAKIAAAAAKLHGLEAQTPSGLVGEAKKSLSEQCGLTNAAWRALAGDKELRDLYAKSVARSSLAMRSSAKGRPSSAILQVVSEEIMRAAESSGKSPVAKVARALGKERAAMDVQATSKALSAGSSSGMDAVEMAECLRLLGMDSAAPLRAMLSGSLPGLPVRAEADDCSLFSGADDLPAIHEDAKALASLGPALLRGVAARHRRNAAGAASPEQARELTMEMVADIVDCACAMPPGFWSGLDKKDPFSHAMRMHDEWAAEVRTRAVDKNPLMGDKWLPAGGGVAEGRTESIELLNGRQLHAEGEAMRHCVASYAVNCLQGSTRIFSLLLDGVRASTLQMVPCDARGNKLGEIDFGNVDSRRKVKLWKAVQHRGKCNAQVTHPELLAMAIRMEASATQAFASCTDAMAEEVAKRLALRREALSSSVDADRNRPATQ